MKPRQNYSGSIGHDLRAPIGRIVQLLQLQKEKPGMINGEAQTQHEEKLNVASENVLETMEDLLLWSKSQMQHFTPEFRMVNVQQVIQKEVGLVKDMAGEKKLQIIEDIPEGFRQNTDENFLIVIIRNLLQNAVKYSGQGTVIRIKATAKEISISNQSMKAKAEILNARLNDNRVDSGGSGLGLQIANDLATSIHAKLSFIQENDTSLTVKLNWD